MPAWSAGTDPKILAQAPSCRTFYNALGSFAAVMSLVTGTMIAVAIAYASGSSKPNWIVAVAAAAVMLCLERLILQIAPARWTYLVPAALPRLAISLLLAFTVSDVISLKTFEPEIRSQLAESRAARLAQVDRDVERLYGSKITASKQEITRLLQNERKVADRIAREDLRAGELRGACTARCTFFRALAARDRQLLARMRTRNAGRISGRRDQLRMLREQSRSYAASRRAVVAGQDGLLARAEALGTIKDKHPSVRYLARLITALLIAFDLAAFTTKIVRIIRGDAYHAILAGQEDQERLRGSAASENARTERARQEAEGRAKRRADQATADWRGFDVDADSSVGEPIDTFSSQEMADGQRWEARPAAVPEELRRGGLIGAALLLASTVAAIGLTLAAAPLVVVLLLAAIGLFAYTGGFRSAPAWGQRGVFAVFLAGLTAPVLLLALNV